MPATRWEKIRFFVSLFVCLAVIMGSAIWAYALREKGAPALAKPAAERAAPRAALLRPVADETLRGVAAVCWEETLGCFAAHEGVDLAAQAGERVVAAADGVVTGARRDRLWGGVAEVTGGDGAICRYAALSWPLDVAEGDSVTAGQTLGRAGSAPREAALAPHIHFEFLVNGEITAPEFE